MPLNRESTQRKSDKWLQQQLLAKNTVFILMWHGNFFFEKIDQSAVKIVQLTRGTAFLNKLFCEQAFIEENICLLGIENNTGTATFVIDLNSFFDNEQDVLTALLQLDDLDTTYLTFRQSLSLTDKELASTLGYARALVYWHQSTKFCGCCGSKMKSVEAGHSRQCTSSLCENIIFPRTDPVVIMLVELKEPGQPAKCLLAAHKRSPDNLLSIIAGFVDPGESLEQAVIRESYEEVGLTVEKVEYMTSQPWSFPHSLMMGFYAQAKTKDIIIDADELTSSSWFTADEIKKFSDWGENNTNYQIPRKESIARFLIDNWVKNNSRD